MWRYNDLKNVKSGKCVKWFRSQICVVSSLTARVYQLAWSQNRNILVGKQKTSVLLVRGDLDLSVMLYICSITLVVK